MNNLSPVSVYDNVISNDQCFSKSSLYRTINDLLSVNGDVEVILYCPLCVNTFEYKFSLFEHLISFHHNFLMKVRDKTLHFKDCPFCGAKFYGKHLTARHGLLHHSKFVSELYMGEAYKCNFCGLCLSNVENKSNVKHIENVHFMDFEDEFRKKYGANVIEMTFSDYINSTVGSGKSSFSLLDCSLGDEDEILSTKQCQYSSTMKDFEGASVVNCFDFTDLKAQLQSIKDSKENLLLLSSKKKSILKNMTNVPTQKSVRRVLRFDLPNEENKENLFPSKTCTDELSFLCNTEKQNIKNFWNGSINDWFNVPQHCSTPNAKKSIGKILVKDIRKFKQGSESIFNNGNNASRSLINYEYQCGKCRELFKENKELVTHIKHNHKKFDLKVLKPSYRCAICNAKFFKNHYLKKHHRLHKPY